MNPADMVECLVDKSLKYLPKEYRTRTGDVRAICAATVFSCPCSQGEPYDGDLVRIFGGFKNEDGSVRTTYDDFAWKRMFSGIEGMIQIRAGFPSLPIVGTDWVFAHLEECGIGTGLGTPPPNWRGRG